MDITFEIKFEENIAGKIHRCTKHFSGSFPSIQKGKDYVLEFLGFNEDNPNLTLLSIKPTNL